MVRTAVASGYTVLGQSVSTEIVNSGDCGTIFGGWPEGTLPGSPACPITITKNIPDPPLTPTPTITPTPTPIRPTPTNSPNPCANVKCGNGGYCGGNCGNTGYPDTVYNCQNNKTVSAVDCNPYLCYYNSKGSDYCGTGSQPTITPGPNNNCQFSCVSSSVCNSANGGQVENGFCAESRTCCCYAGNNCPHP